MKIVYVIDSLASKGGAERIISEKMNYLATHYNDDVSVITCYQDPKVSPNAYYLSEHVKQINLNIPFYSQYKYKYPQRLWVKYSLYRKLCKKLNNVILNINPDILIGLGYFMGDFISSIKCRAKKIIESHEARIFTMSDQGLNRFWFSKIYMELYRRLYFKTIDKNADVVVTLTHGDAKEWEKAKRVEVIPNFTMMRPATQSYDCNSKRVIVVGRLEWQKGYDNLIKIWEIVSNKHPDWELAIFGEGTLKDSLYSMIKTMGLTNIEIYPFTPNISQEYSKSAIFTLSSRFEGFPLVLLEAMQHGLPCIAFNCPYGPSDIIKNDTCGYVIENNDIKIYAEKVCKLIESEELRLDFSSAARHRVNDFNIVVIMEMWKKLFETLTFHKNEDNI